MATRRYRNNKSKKSLKKRGSRRRKNVRSSRRMRGGELCKINTLTRLCEYPFKNNKVYIDNQNNEYIFDSLTTTPQQNNANQLCGVYSFITKMDEGTKNKLGIKNDTATTIIKKNSCIDSDKLFLDSLTPKSIEEETEFEEETE
jgi:hypothetical protein